MASTGPTVPPPHPPTHMDRMGATLSREAMRMPVSQMRAVSSRAHVGSPLAFPWPNTCRDTTRGRASSGEDPPQGSAGAGGSTAPRPPPAPNTAFLNRRPALLAITCHQA